MPKPLPDRIEIAVTHKDAKGALFIDCHACAVANAVMRTLNLGKGSVHEHLNRITINEETYHHAIFGMNEFFILQNPKADPIILQLLKRPA